MREDWWWESKEVESAKKNLVDAIHKFERAVEEVPANFGPVAHDIAKRFNDKGTFSIFPVYGEDDTIIDASVEFFLPNELEEDDWPIPRARMSELLKRAAKDDEDIMTAWESIIRRVKG